MYRLSIITPSGKVFEEEIDSLQLPGVEGSFGVLKNHIPIVTLLKKGLVTIKQQNQSKYFSINSGILEVNAKTDVLLLADEAVETSVPNIN